MVMPVEANIILVPNVFRKVLPLAGMCSLYTQFDKVEQGDRRAIQVTGNKSFGNGIHVVGFVVIEWFGRDGPAKDEAHTYKSNEHYHYICPPRWYFHEDAILSFVCARSEWCFVSEPVLPAFGGVTWSKKRASAIPLSW